MGLVVELQMGKLRTVTTDYVWLSSGMLPWVAQRPTQDLGNSSDKGDDAGQNRQEVHRVPFRSRTPSSQVAARPISVMKAAIPNQNAIRLNRRFCARRFRNGTQR